MTIKWMIQGILPMTLVSAIVFSAIGIAYKIIRYGWNRITMRRELGPRPYTSFPAKGNGLLKSFMTVNVYSYTRFWMRANPVTFAGHVFYHTGLFIGMGSYGLAILLSYRKLLKMPFYQAMQTVFDWFQHKNIVYGTNGMLAILGDIMYFVFIAALLIAVIGMAIPFIMTAFNKRGMIRPIDLAIKNAGVCPTLGLKTQGWQAYQRKAIGIIVLIMDAAMLITFFAPVAVEMAYVIHVSFAIVIIASLPFSFLFHELYRLRMWSGLLRVKDGRIA